jgi:hypothetical protein
MNRLNGARVWITQRQFEFLPNLFVFVAFQSIAKLFEIVFILDWVIVHLLK